MTLIFKYGLPLLLLTVSPAPAQMPPGAPAFDAPAYLDEAIATVREHALFADRVDWPAVSGRIHRLGDKATTPFDTYPALVELVRALGDHHSFLQLSTERAAMYRAAKGHDFVYPPDPDPPRRYDPRFARRPGPAPADTVVDGQRVRSVVVTANGDNAPEALQRYALALHRALVTGPRACGYVIDLRGNGGGNMMPMLAGLGVLLGNGPVGGFVAKEGGEDWIIRRNLLLLRSAQGSEQVALRLTGWQPMADGARRPVALLIDGGTASSGELTAIAFAGRANMATFGAHSFGASTATSGFRLRDGANLVIVDSQVRDRTGRRYPDGLAPDHATDPTAAPEAARRWVAARCRSATGA
jgi:hypothetical protein